MGADLKKFNSVQKDLEASQKIFEHKLLAVSAESEETGKSVSEVKEEVQQVRSDITKISSFNLDVSPTELEDFGVQKTPISNVDFFLSQLMIIFLTTNKLKSFAKDLQIALVDVDRNTHATKTMVEEASSHIVNLRSNVESLQREQHELMEQHQELKAIVESTSKDSAKHREMSDQKLGHFTEYVSGEFKEVESKIESLRGTCSNESVVRHLVSALEKTNAEFKAQQDFHKIFVENTRAEMLALHSKVEGLLKEKHSDKPPVQNFTTTIATMPSELDAMRFGIEQTRKEMTNMAVKQRRVEDLLGQKADLR
jgi:chromosome segregation ATPase